MTARVTESLGLLPAQFVAGETHYIGEPEELRKFEDAIARQVDPLMDLNSEYHAWDGRPDLIAELGERADTVMNIGLTIMTNAYPRLLNATDEGWSFPYKTPYKRDVVGNLTAKTLGLVLTADHRIRSYDATPFKVGVWYVPTLQSQHKHRGSRLSRTNGQYEATVRRYVSNPIYEAA